MLIVVCMLVCFQFSSFFLLFFSAQISSAMAGTEPGFRGAESDVMLLLLFECFSLCRVSVTFVLIFQFSSSAVAGTEPSG